MRTSAVFKYPCCSSWESQETTTIAEVLKKNESTDNCSNFVSAESLDFQSGARIEEVYMDFASKFAYKWVAHGDMH